MDGVVLICGVGAGYEGVADRGVGYGVGIRMFVGDSRLTSVVGPTLGVCVGAKGPSARKVTEPP